MRGLAILVALSGACLAQQYEIGAAAGGSFSNNASVTSGSGSATAGFKTGAAFGGFIGHNMYSHVSGEVRYSFLQNDLKLSSGGTQATFKGQAHALHYDLLFHPKKAEAKALPFLAAGGGFKLYRGVGTESAYQPLYQYAFLTRTQEWKPLVSVGGGVRFTLSRNMVLRTEVRDYITPFPTKVIAPAPGAKISGWVH